MLVLSRSQISTLFSVSFSPMTQTRKTQVTWDSKLCGHVHAEFLVWVLFWEERQMVMFCIQILCSSSRHKQKYTNVIEEAPAAASVLCVPDWNSEVRLLSIIQRTKKEMQLLISRVCPHSLFLTICPLCASHGYCFPLWTLPPVLPSTLLLYWHTEYISLLWLP